MMIIRRRTLTDHPLMICNGWGERDERSFCSQAMTTTTKCRVSSPILNRPLGFYSWGSRINKSQLVFLEVSHPIHSFFYNYVYARSITQKFTPWLPSCLSHNGNSFLVNCRTHSKSFSSRDTRLIRPLWRGKLPGSAATLRTRDWVRVWFMSYLLI